MKKTFADAHKLAQRGHAEMTYGGQPYMVHIDGVLAIVRSLIEELPPGTLSAERREQIEILAALHDIPEDHEKTGITHEMIAAEGYDPDLCRWLKRLDNALKVGSYQNNIEAMVVEGEIAIMIVKLADNTFNGRPENIASLPPERQGMRRRYERAAGVLRSAFDEFKDAAWAAHRGDR